MLSFTDVLLVADEPCSDGRVYPREELERAVEQFKQTKSMVGELGVGQNVGVDVNNISHEIDDMYMEGNELKATVKVLSTPKGKVLDELIRAGFDFDTRIRGMGCVSSENVVSDFTLVTADVVPKDE